jgi:hypothetical protein
MKVQSGRVRPLGDRASRGILLLLLSALAPAGAEAQTRPFLFSFSSSGWSAGKALVYYEPGYAERSADSVSREGFENRLGLEARFARRLSVLSALSLADEGSGSLAAFRVEGLYDVVGGGSHRFRVSAGVGYLREAEGISVGLGRLVAEGGSDDWRASGNLRLEKPFTEGRDAVDLITSLGLSRRVGSAWGVGFEVVGEDLEGLWEAEEAEGGARVLVGPSIRFGAPSRRLSASLCGGPVFTIHGNDQTSGAVRSLGTGYAVRLSFAYVF